MCVCVCVCLCVYVCVCVSVYVSLSVPRKRDSLETVEVIIITASDLGMHHMLIIVTLTDGHILSVKNTNVRLFQKRFKQCPSGLL